MNLTGAFLGARAAARVMGDGGRLIFTGSVLGERPRQGPRRVQRLEGRARRPGQGARARPGARGHHRERRRARAGSTRRWPTGGRTTRSSRPAILGHTAQQRWGDADRPRRRVPVPRLRRLGVRHRHRAQRRRRVPARMTRRGGSSRSPGRAARSAPRSPRQLRRRARHRPRAERRQRAVARRDRRRPAGGATARSRRCWPTSSDFAAGRSRRRPGGRALRPPRRADQQRRRALAERPHPQPDDRGLGARVPGQRPRRGQRHPGRGAGHARRSGRARSC